jgi:mannose/cellobiose epimerase-like protein (N-acyl-D-glucosamine 2-epimerase family)
MKHVFAAAAAVVLLASTAQAAPAPSWKSESFWRGAVVANLDFFRTHAWDETSGSYASELDVAGRRHNENRDVVALSRMIYADATAPGGRRDLVRARRVADFLLKNMAARDSRGLYFKSVVDGQGAEVASGRGYVFIFEEAYPIAGLTALYAADPVANADLLPILREAARAFWNRFHDPIHGGLFYYSNLARGDATNDQGLVHKSYQSTVYPVSSFLLALRKADPRQARLYDSWIRELLTTAVTRLVERKAGRPTGWLVERTDAAFVPDETYRMTEAGHITQLAWVLGVAVEQGIVATGDREAYLDLSRTLLAKLVESGGFSPLGVVYDAFDRTTGLPWVEGAAAPTTAWWSNLEAVIAYAFADKHSLLAAKGDPRIARVLDGLTRAYGRYFMDAVRGGEFFRIDARTGTVIDSTKGGPGKSAYHVGEAYDYLFGVAGLAR